MYFLRRLLLIFPSLLILILLSFLILHHAPGNPFENTNQDEGSGGNAEQELFLAQRHGLHLPLFYFSIHSLAEKKWLIEIPQQHVRDGVTRLVRANGNSNAIRQYYQTWKSTTDNNSTFQELSAGDIHALKHIFSLKTIEEQLARLKEIRSRVQHHSLSDLCSAAEEVQLNPEKWRAWFPSISFYGDNRFHRWFFGDNSVSQGVIHGDLGTSYITGQPVSTVISSSIWWTVLLSIISVLIAKKRHQCNCHPERRYRIKNAEEHRSCTVKG